MRASLRPRLPAGAALHRKAVPRDVVDSALRRINVRLLKGITAREVDAWKETACWFPDIAHDTAFWPLALPFQEYGAYWTQILLEFPDPSGLLRERPLHVDQQPAERPRFHTVVGIALTPQGPETGGVQFEPGGQLRLAPGDAIRFPADTPHTGGINRTGAIRYAVYFRFLERAWLSPR